VRHIFSDRLYTFSKT